MKSILELKWTKQCGPENIRREHVYRCVIKCVEGKRAMVFGVPSNCENNGCSI